MNPYFWAFVLYAVLIAPVRVRVQLVMGRGFRYRIQMAAAGLPVYQKDKSSETDGNKRKRRKRMLSAFVARRDLPGRIFGMFSWRMAEVQVHLSLQDAAATALSCAAVQQVMHTAARCVHFPLTAKVSADFRGEGSVLRFQCIADTRVGNLSAAAVRLWLAAAAGSTKKTGTEEENDAAPY